MKIFLDDVRLPPSHWNPPVVVCRNYEQFIQAVWAHDLPDFISFDHDLSEPATGMDCAKWLVDWLLDRKLYQPIKFTVHSANPVGKENIESLLNNWNKNVFGENNEC